MILDSDLMELVQLYRSRWLSCVTQEEAQRLRDENARLKEELATPTHGVMPASNVIAGDRTIEAIVADMAHAAAFIREHDLFDVHHGLPQLFWEGAELIEELAASIERLRKFEEYDKRLRESGARARANYSDDDWRNPST